MITEGRLINKEEPILIIKKNPKLKFKQKYFIEFTEIEQKIKINRILENFNKDFFQLKIGTKIKGHAKLQYKINYKIKLTKERNQQWNN